MIRRRIAITGIGLVTPFGLGIEPFWRSLMSSRTAVRPVQGFDASDLPVDHCAELPPIDFAKFLGTRRSLMWSRCSKTAVVAAIHAMQDANLAIDIDPFRSGVILGTGYGCTYEFEETYQAWHQGGWRRIKPITVPRGMPNAPASIIAMEFQFHGLNSTVSTACSSGATAIGLAAHAIRSGCLDLCLAGGADVYLNASTMASWCALRILSRRNDPTACRPFSVDRDGLVLGEGCCVLVLEDWERAKSREVRIFAELSGVGFSNDAAHIVEPDTVAEAAAIRMALEDARLAAGDIDYVNAHGTGTVANDAVETRTLKEALGEHAGAIPVSSIKGHLGHTMGAAGAIETAATALALMEQRIPPTLHFQAGDPDCDLDYVPGAPRSVSLRNALTNSFGFGGQNVALVLSHE